MLISWDITKIFRIHGIFTDDYLKKHGREISIKRAKLKLNHDIIKLYIIPANHFIEKGMVI
jgi:hypothetical protein